MTINFQNNLIRLLLNLINIVADTMVNLRLRRVFWIAWLAFTCGIST